MTTLDLYKGDKVKITIGVSNENDGYTGKYKVSVVLKDKDKRLWYLEKFGITYDFTTTAYQAVDESMTAGMSYSFTYTAAVPDTAEGVVLYDVGIYDETGTTDIIDFVATGEDWPEAYNYSKKKMKLGSLSVKFEKG